MTSDPCDEEPCKCESHALPAPVAQAQVSGGEGARPVRSKLVHQNGTKCYEEPPFPLVFLPRWATAFQTSFSESPLPDLMLCHDRFSTA